MGEERKEVGREGDGTGEWGKIQKIHEVVMFDLCHGNFPFN